jgi:uncharacterized membrane-anchored protein YitT (DUF2179 family)
MNSQNKYLRLFVHLILVLIGNIILAFGIDAFALPSKLIVSGSSGVGIIIKQFLPVIDISTTVFIINMLALVVGYFYLGKEFIAGTLVSSFAFPFFLAFFENIPSLAHLTNDRLLSAIFAGICTGIGLGIVFRVGYSTGGLDIPPVIFNKKFGFSVGTMINVFDLVILIGQIPFSNFEGILYGIICVLVSTYLIDRAMMLGESNVQVIIISDRYEEIARMIYRDVDRGVTFLNVTTGYLRNETKAILVILSRRQYTSFNEDVQKIDPYAFVIASDVHSVKGRGFTLPDINMPRNY